MATEKKPKTEQLDAQGLAWVAEINGCHRTMNALRAQLQALQALATATEARAAARLDALRAVYGLQEGDRVDDSGVVHRGE